MTLIIPKMQREEKRFLKFQIRKTQVPLREKLSTFSLIIFGQLKNENDETHKYSVHIKL